MLEDDHRTRLRGETPMSRHQDHRPNRFPTTHWSLVARAGDEELEARRQALSELVVAYLPALRTHLVYRKGLAAEQADDVLQEFVAQKVLEKNLIAHADRALGKFRTFLLTALDRFLYNWLRHQHLGRRVGGGQRVTIDEVEQECLGREETPSEAFDVSWARQIIQGSLARMRTECEASGRRELWSLFECRVVRPTLEGQPSPSYQELVERFGFSSPSQGSNMLVTAKRMYARALRSVVGEYARDEQDVDDELADLQTILARCGSVARAGCRDNAEGDHERV
jgi:RNA polymerase sigma-70 factor (ECF subfamily)